MRLFQGLKGCSCAISLPQQVRMSGHLQTTALPFCTFTFSPIISGWTTEIRWHVSLVWKAKAEKEQWASRTISSLDDCWWFFFYRDLLRSCAGTCATFSSDVGKTISTCALPVLCSLPIQVSNSFKKRCWICVRSIFNHFWNWVGKHTLTVQSLSTTRNIFYQDTFFPETDLFPRVCVEISGFDWCCLLRHV